MDGIIIIDKPKGFTSHDVVGKLRKILNTRKIGHTGTLDPNATGVLPICVGIATKASEYLIEHTKTYAVELKLGEKTDTGDGEGNIISKVPSGTFLNPEEMTRNEGVPPMDDMHEDVSPDGTRFFIEQVLKSFLGKQQQIPPMYSAIKIDGKKLYEYARAGVEIERTPRDIEIYSISMDSIDIENNIVNFTVDCSKGTYIRVLCEDIAERLGTVGHMKNLRRTRVGDFCIEQSISLEELEKNKNNLDFLSKNFISLEKLFSDKKEIILDETQINNFLNGVCLEFVYDNDTYRIYNKNNSFIGTGVIKGNKLKREIVL